MRWRVLLIIIVVACGHSRPVLTQAERTALAGTARTAYDRKDYPACYEALERAETWYDAACCRALAGSAAAAFADLERAPIRDLTHFEADPDLASLHADPRWPALREAIGRRFAEYRKTVNAELLQLFTDDQADRMLPIEQMDWKVIEPRDRAREQRVDAIVAAGGAKVADDHYHAAMVLQHGKDPSSKQRAHDLAVKAATLDPSHGRAKWLAAAALDRMLMEQHKPQKYGTQFQIRDGVWILWEVDPAVTDAERAAWNVPPLAAAKARAAAMNAHE
jgi:hypothetical protein